MPKSQQKTQNNPQVRNNDDKALIDADNIYICVCLHTYRILKRALYSHILWLLKRNTIDWVAINYRNSFLKQFWRLKVGD